VIQENSKTGLQNWEIVSVNPSDKIWNWKDLFCFWGNNIQSIIGFSLIASLYLVYNLNFLDLNNFTKMSLIIFMILGRIEIIAMLYFIMRFIFRE